MVIYRTLSNLLIGLFWTSFEEVLPTGAALMKTQKDIQHPTSRKQPEYVRRYEMRLYLSTTYVKELMQTAVNERFEE